MSEATKRIIDEAKRRVSDWVNWIAVDDSGQIWGYEFKPLWSDSELFWFDYGGGRMELITDADIVGTKETIWAM